MVFRLLPSILIHYLVLGLTTAALNDNVCKTSLTTSGILAKATVSTSNSIGFQNGAWCGTQGSPYWIEFDFGAAIAVREIQISKPNTGYVQSFSIQYVGLQGTALQNYGNDPNHAAVINALDERLTSAAISLTGVVLKKIRINIESYKTAPCLKLDLLGCTNPNDICPLGCQNGGQCYLEESCACPAGYEGKQCQTPISHSGECASRLGMADSRIPDSALSVSSSRLGHGKEKARYGCCTNEAHGAWCPANTDQNPWYEVKFDKPQSVGGLDFLHPTHPPGVVASEYLKTFELRYWSVVDSQETWRTFSKDVPAIYNDTLYYTIQLTPSITVKAIRIIPQTFKSAPCIRFDVLGCDPKVLCPTNFCKNGGSCVGLNTCTCRTGFVGNQCEKPASQVVTINAGFQAIVNQVLQTTTTIKFTVHGNVQLVPGVTGQAVHITSSAQYLTIDNNGFTSCLKDIDSCTGGFTISTHVKLETLTENTYIISSGANNPNTKGIALYYKNNQLHFVVSTSTQKWHLSTSYHLTLNTWHHIELSWQKNLGCELIDNGKLVGSVTQPIAHHATLVHQIAIGHGYTATTSTHISMKVEGLTTVDANRASLSIAGILPTEGTTVATSHTTQAPTTTTTTVPTTIPTTQTTAFVCGGKHVNFDFMNIKDNILVTPQYNFTVYKNPVIRREDHGKAVLVLNTTGQYVELPYMGLECIQDMTKCENGFTLSLEIKWLDMNSTNKRYIFSSGGDKVNNSGIALYLWHDELYCSAKKDNTIWFAKEKLNVKPGEWHSFQVSWNKQVGFIVYLDGKVFTKNRIRLPNPAQNGVHPLLIAASPVHTDTSLMEVRNLYTWTASRDVLIDHTCITEFPTVEPTTTTTPTPEITTVHALSNLDSTGISISQPTERHDVTCNANSMSVSIPSALIPYNHKLTWRDPHCLPLDNGTHYISTVSHQACGTTVRFTQDSVIFENDLIILQPGASKGSSHDIINFGNTNTEVIPVQCIYPRHQNLTDAYRPAQKRIRFYEKRYGSMDVELEEYQTDQFLSIVPGTTYPREVSLNEDMYIKLRVIHNTSNVAIKVDSCVATSSVMPADGQVYQLLDHGCPASPAVKLYPSTVNEVKFGIRAFQFTSSPGNVVYIHCQVSVCSPRDPQCIVSCNGRRKRAAQESADDSSHLVSGGPYLLVSDEGSVQASTIVAVVCACVAVIAIVFGLIGWRRKSVESKTTL